MFRGRLRKLRSMLVAALASFMTVHTIEGERRGQQGAALVEYALLLGLVAMVGISALLLIGGYVSQDIGSAANSFRP